MLVVVFGPLYKRLNGILPLSTKLFVALETSKVFDVPRSTFRFGALIGQDNLKKRKTLALVFSPYKANPIHSSILQCNDDSLSTTGRQCGQIEPFGAVSGCGVLCAGTQAATENAT